MNLNLPRLCHVAVAWGLLWCAASPPMSPAAEANPAASAVDLAPSLRAEMDKLRKESAQLKEEVARLRAEISQLRRENQQLRRLIAERSEITGTNAPARAAEAHVKPESSEAAESALTHWLSTASGKRHNSTCRFFKTTEGAPCRANEGQACKICGG